MSKTKELLMRLREEDDFINDHIIICTLGRDGTVTTAPNSNK